MTKKKEKYKTIRIYESDHQTLLNRFSRINNFAEIINQLVSGKLKRNK